MNIEVPDNYGLVILGCVVGPFVANMYMGGPVMKARKELDVQYPNLYAVPGLHKNADQFNRIQRGHQNMFESLTSFTAMSLLGGLKYPVACAGCGVVYSLGNVLYQAGYADMKEDAQVARFKKGGPVKYLGYFGALGCCISLAGSIQGWW